MFRGGLWAGVVLVVLASAGCQPEVDEEALAEEIRAEIEPRIRKEIQADLEEKMREQLQAKLAIELDTRLIALGLQEPGWEPPPEPEPEPEPEDVDGEVENDGGERSPRELEEAAEAAAAGEAPPPTIERVVIATGIESRRPVGEGDTFDKGVGELYCYIEVHNEGPALQLEAEWHQGETRHAGTTLDVGRSPSWRTWARSKIPGEIPGDWTCSIRHGDGVLARATFKVRPPLPDEESEAAP